MGQLARQIEEMLAVLKSIDSKTKPDREIMSVPQAAQYLGQSEHTLREWVRLRKIPFSKINGAIKFRRSKLDRWIDQHEIAIME